MAETVILAEQTISGFVSTDATPIVEIQIPIVEGQQYTVVWNGVDYTCESFVPPAALGVPEGVLGIGNRAMYESVASGGSPVVVEPFVISYAPASITGSVDVLEISCMEDGCSSDSHTVAIYQIVEEEDPEGIVLKDRNGEPVAYYGIETVTFDTTTEGKQQTYTKGTAVEGLEIVPDFSGGDMSVVAPGGTLVRSATIKKPEALTPENIRNGEEVGGIPGTFIGDTEEVTLPLAMADGDMVIEPSEAGKVLSKVIVQKPETLVPENIAEGIDVAGIIGTLVAGGGVNVAYGTFTGNKSEVTVEHSLGVVPDFVFVVAPTKVYGGNVNYLVSAYACSSAFKSLCGIAWASAVVRAKSTSSSSYDTSWGNSIANVTSPASFIYAQETNITFGKTYVTENTDYFWLAIGGLT